jgi:hypothetical protein
MAFFLVGISSVSAKATKTNDVYVVVGPTMGYGNNSNNVNSSELELHNDDDLLD